MRGLKLTIAYDGTRYVGWQIQNNGMSIQQELESTWTLITGERIRITASGRTDSGVHALAQVCGMSTESALPVQQIVRALNGNLPYDIRVLEAKDVSVGFHPIRDAKSKTYRYQLQTGTVHDVFDLRYRWFVPRSLDFRAMQSSANLLVGRHDFSSFEATGAPREDSIRTVTSLKVNAFDYGPYQNVDIEITADGFLYNMVRNIVGTLIVVGRGRRPIPWVGQVLQARNRQKAGETAPAHGLFLVNVNYGAP